MSSQDTESWERHGLPARIDGRSFLDVGCWEGVLCIEALRRGAASALGIDYCTSPELLANRKDHPFDFLQLDVFSEKLLQLPEFDFVHTSGVLYHVENPLSFLYRMRKLCRLGGWLHLETTVFHDDGDLPVMMFHPQSSLDGNPSNWWTPNALCLREMLEEVGFADLETTMLIGSPGPKATASIGRIAMRGRAMNTPDQLSAKILPRRPTYMPDSAWSGSRAVAPRDPQDAGL